MKTIWDPTRSDIGHGINKLVFDNLKRRTPADVQKLAAARPELVALWEERYDPPLALERLDVSPAAGAAPPRDDGGVRPQRWA